MYLWKKLKGRQKSEPIDHGTGDSHSEAAPIVQSQISGDACTCDRDHFMMLGPHHEFGMSLGTPFYTPYNFICRPCAACRAANEKQAVAPACPDSL